MNKPVEMISLPIAELLRAIPTRSLVHEAINRLEDAEATAVTPHVRGHLPAIGEPLDGGIYAGLTIHDHAPAALILLPGDEKLTWKESVEWARKQGGVLPSRLDLLVLYQNLKGQFQETWYWSATQYAGDDAYAWYQSFGYGYQSDFHKVSQCSARAVRRSPIE